MQLRFREFVFIMLLLALPVASYFLIFKPRSELKAQVVQEVAAKNAQLAQLNAAVAGNADLPQQIDEIKKALDLFESKLPQKREMDKVLKEVWQIAKDNNLSTKSVRTLAAIPAAEYSEQPIRIVFSGPFIGFCQFLRDTENLPRITRIKDLSLARDDKNAGQIKAEFTLSIYFEGDSVAGVN